MYGFYDNREIWKDKNNSFRTDKDILLTSIPTLLRWKNEKNLQRKTLEENELLDEEYLEWFFYVHEYYLTNATNGERYQLKYHDEFVKFARNFNPKKKLLTFYFYGEKNETVKQDQNTE